jgi:hypothetical protein
MFIRWELAVSLLGAAASSPAHAQRNPIVGTWLIETIVDTLPDHSVSYWMGRHPMGAIIYDATGHVAVALVRDPPPRFATEASRVSGADLRDAYDGYYGYFGRYRLNARADSVTHIVEISHRPDESGRVYRRAFQVAGDRLILSYALDANGVPYRRVLTWKRAR